MRSIRSIIRVSYRGLKMPMELLDWGYAGLVGNIPYTEDFPHNNEAWNMTEPGISETD